MDPALLGSCMFMPLLLCYIYLAGSDMERWVSGLNQQFAKLPYTSIMYRGFESPSLRSWI